jgi:hypothetical protein
MHIRRSVHLIQKRPESGFSLTTTLLIGLAMLLVCSTLIFRSLSDQQIASAQVAAARSSAIAETGVSRVQRLLLNYPGLAAKPDVSTWTSAIAATAPTASCSGPASPAPVVSTQDTSLIAAIAAENWINIDDANTSKGQFKVLSYTISSTNAALRVQGRMDSTSRSANSAVQAEMPLIFPSPQVPGIWVGATATLPFPVTSTPIEVITDQSLQANMYIFDDPTSSFDLATYTTYNPSKINPNKFVAPYGVAPYGAAEAPNPKPAPPTRPAGVPVMPLNLASPTTLLLPRPTDFLIAGKYRYFIQNDLNLSDQAQVILSPGARVVFYLEKNLNISDQAKLNNSGSPENLEIYGSSQILDYSTPADSVFTTAVDIASTNAVNAFIYAPQAKTSLTQGKLNGAVWSSEFYSSHPSPAIAVEEKCLRGLEVSPTSVTTANLRPVQSWERKPVS